MFELREIQAAFMRHFKAATPAALNVPDGDYIVPVYDEPFNVRIKDNNVSILIGDEERLALVGFDPKKAVRI